MGLFGFWFIVFKKMGEAKEETPVTKMFPIMSVYFSI